LIGIHSVHPLKARYETGQDRDGTKPPL
jgi:hypothetical protein